MWPPIQTSRWVWIGVSGHREQSPVGSGPLTRWNRDLRPRCAGSSSEPCLTTDHPDEMGRSARSLDVTRGCHVYRASRGAPSTVRARPLALRHECRCTGAHMLKTTEPQFDLQPDDLVISLDDLWLRCFALGTMNTATELEAFLRDVDRPTRHEYNVIAVALNEYFVEIGSKSSHSLHRRRLADRGYKPARRRSDQSNKDETSATSPAGGTESCLSLLDGPLASWRAVHLG